MYLAQEHRFDAQGNKGVQGPAATDDTRGEAKPRGSLTGWMEQPENIPTAIALKPYRRNHVAPLLKKYQLFK